MLARIALLVITASLCYTVEGVPGEKRLHADLLAGYNNQVRPVLNESDTVHAAIGLSLIEFSLDTHTDVLESLIWLRLKWKDQYLRWQPREYDNISTSMFNPAEIWTPDICLYNSWEKNCQLFKDKNTNAIVSSDGTVLFIPPVRLSSRCTLDRTNWPRDIATCQFKFGSWTHHGFLINLTLYDTTEKAVDTSDLRLNMNWELTNTSRKLEAKYYSCCSEPYFSYLASLSLRRNEHRTAQLTMPIICAAVFMFLSFLVPLLSPQKLTLSWVSVFFSLLGLLNMFFQMPIDAHGVATIATFYISFTVLLLIFALLEVLVVCVARPRPTPLPRCLRSCLSGIAGKLLCLDTPVFRDYTPDDNEMLDSSQDGEFQKLQQRTGAKSYEWVILAEAIDRLCGLVFLLIVAVTVPPNITWSD